MACPTFAAAHLCRLLVVFPKGRLVSLERVGIEVGRLRRVGTRAALERNLAALATRLSADELRLLVFIASRACRGRARYGSLNLRRDQRDFAQEALEEVGDALFYTSAALLRGRRHARARGHRRKMTTG